MFVKPKELGGLDQKGEWVVRMFLWSSDTGNIPTGRQSGPTVSDVEYADRANPMPSPFMGRLTVRHTVGGMGRDDGRSECYPVMG
jgi:hypothetical protein